MAFVDADPTGAPPRRPNFPEWLGNVFQQYLPGAMDSGMVGPLGGGGVMGAVRSGANAAGSLAQRLGPVVSETAQELSQQMPAWFGQRAAQVAGQQLRNVRVGGAVPQWRMRVPQNHPSQAYLPPRPSRPLPAEPARYVPRWGLGVPVNRGPAPPDPVPDWLAKQIQGHIRNLPAGPRILE